jgi:hypothetical protein
MKLYTKKQLYIDQNTSDYSYYKEFDNGLVMKAEIIFHYGEYAQYQETLIKEALHELETEASSPKFSVIKFKSYFELILQELNSKLAVFTDKLRIFQKIEIRGYIEFFMDNYYVCTLIGDSSLIIFRKSSLYYSLHNDATSNKKIDLFAELIEWDLDSGDEIIYFANNISYFTDSEDFAYVGEINGTDERTILQIIEDMLSERTELKSIGMINLDFVKFDEKIIWITKSQTASDYVDTIHYWFKKRRYMMSIVGFGLLMLILVGLLFANFFQTKTGVRIGTTDGATQEYFSLAWLKQEIEEFKALDPTAPEKHNMYKNLENKIAQLEQEGKLPLDIDQLKNMLVSEYQAWFNIETVDQLDDWTINFNSTDLLDIGTPIQLFAWQQLSIVGNAWVIIGASSDEVRGIVQKLGLDSRIEWCTTNLQANGLLCFDNIDSIYNITKQNIQTASVGSGSFEKEIQQLGTFGNSNMYILVKNPDLNSAGTYVVRYPLIPGTKEAFKSPINYAFMDGMNPSAVSSMAIDGSFLLWSSKDEVLYQLRRDGTESKSRKVTLQWGKELYTKSSTPTATDPALPAQAPVLVNENLKVLTYPNSSFVYLYEPTKRILLVYKSNPAKTSDWSKYSYGLKYFFALQLTQKGVIDVAISDSSKPQLYVLTNKGVANIKLYDYIESFEAVEKSNAQAKQVGN